MTFYVYRIIGQMGETLYIGKGTGRRLDQQKLRFQSEGEILQSFATEDAAYRREKRLIEIHSPPLNQCSGGGGSKFGASQGIPEWQVFRSLAMILQKLTKFDSLTILGVEVRRSDIEQVVLRAAQRYDPAYFMAQLAPYKFAVEYINKSQLLTRG